MGGMVALARVGVVGYDVRFMAETYTVLARRYRSQDFDELVGQEAIAQTLKNAIKANRVAHAFLFTGTRGVGKTSIARILAKAINCPNRKADGNPCCKCSSCELIARGEDMDVIEIDGASNNGVDSIREIRQAAGIRPARSPYKIYIIDEVHMVTTSGFNALLKTLEEPPEHVKFIFATTDVHKVLPTILSRCQRFDFKNIPTPRIAEHLTKIVKDEGVKADNEAVFRIARLGNGSMRDALSILDRVLSLGEKQITEKLIEDLLGKPPTAAIGGLVGAIAEADAAAAIKAADAMLKEGMGPEQLVGEMIEFLRGLMLVSACGKDTDLLEVPAESREVFVKLAAKFDVPTIVHLLALCEQTHRTLKSTTMARPLLDALLVRLALAEQFSSIREVVKQLQDGSNAQPMAGQKKNDVGPGVRAPVAAPAPAVAAVPVAAPAAVQAPSDGGADVEGDREESIYEVMKTHMKAKEAEKAARYAAPPAGAAPAGPAAPAARRPAAVDPEEEYSSFGAQMRAQIARTVEQQAAQRQQMQQPARGRPTAAGSAAAPVVTMSPEQLRDPAYVWSVIQPHLGYLARTIGHVASLSRIDLEANEITMVVPESQKNFVADERGKAKVEEAFKAATGRNFRAAFEFTEAQAAPEGARSGVGIVQRVSPELWEAVQKTPLVRQLMEKLDAQVVNIEPLAPSE